MQALCYQYKIKTRWDGDSWSEDIDEEPPDRYLIYVYSSGQHGDLDVQTGDIKVKPQFIYFTLNSLYFQQQKQKSEGKMFWNTGSCCKGLLLQDELYSSCKIYSNNGRLGVVVLRDNKYVQFYHSGIFGQFASAFGSMNIKPFSLAFDKKANYIIHYTKPIIGKIRWQNGSCFLGYISFGNIFQNGQLRNVKGEQATVLNMIAYYCDTGKFGKLDMNTGTVKEEKYVLQYQNSLDYAAGYEGKFTGIIKWMNGCWCRCAMYHNKPSGIGEYKDQNGEEGLYYYGIVYMYQTGAFGQLDLSTGLIQCKTYSISFADRNDYIKQNGNNTKCTGTVVWHQSGSIFNGTISKNIICEGVLEVNSVKTRVKYSCRQVTDLDTGKVRGFDMQPGQFV